MNTMRKFHSTEEDFFGEFFVRMNASFREKSPGEDKRVLEAFLG